MKNKILMVCLAALALGGCTKQFQQPFKPTLVYATLTLGHDYMLINSAEGCYGGWYGEKDTVFVYNSNTPDTGKLHVLSWMQAVPTGRIDSSFVFAGQLVTLTGPIYSREFRKLKHINKIEYGSAN